MTKVRSVLHENMPGFSCMSVHCLNLHNASDSVALGKPLTVMSVSSFVQWRYSLWSLGMSWLTFSIEWIYFWKYPIIINVPYTTHYNLRLNAFLMQIHSLYRVITELKRLKLNNRSFFQNSVFVLFFFSHKIKKKTRRTDTMRFCSTKIDWKLI